MAIQPITTRAIARSCGFGQSTVSMALRHDPRIPEATRQTILAAATKLGYQPDPHFSRLMSSVKRRSVQRQTQVLAYVILWKRAQDHYFYRTYREYRAGAQARAAEFGYQLEDFVVNEEGITPRRLDAILRTRFIPGMLVAPVSFNHPARNPLGTENHLLHENYAISTIAYALSRPEVNRAVHDHTLAMEKTVKILRERKFRRIGLVLSRASHLRVQGRWLAGYLLAQQAMLPEEILQPLLLDDINDFPVLAGWLKQERPEVIIALEMDVMQRHLSHLHLRVPHDISLAHLDISGDSPEFAGIIQRNSAIGAAAFDLLLAQILRNERGAPSVRKTVMIEGHWQDGPTLRPSPSPA